MLGPEFGFCFGALRHHIEALLIPCGIPPGHAAGGHLYKTSALMRTARNMRSPHLLSMPDNGALPLCWSF